MKVPLEIYPDEIEGDHGFRDGLVVVCTRCKDRVEVLGKDAGSANFGAKEISLSCPRGEANFYDTGGWS